MQTGTRPQSVRTEAVCRRITFSQVQGRPLNYEVRSRAIYAHTTNCVIGCEATQRVLICMPHDQVSDLRDPSASTCLYAVLTDDRIAASTTVEAGVRSRRELKRCR